MKRTSLTLTIASLLVLILTLPVPLSAQDTTSLGIQFVDCPDQLTVSPGDSAYYRIQAVPVTTTKACPAIHYYLVSGPGWIDSLTGWWSFYPWMEESPLPPSYEVEVAAFFAGDTVLSGERCRFTVNVEGGVTPGYTVRIGHVFDQIQGFSAEIPVTLESIDPQYGFGGFDLLIAYDQGALTFQQAVEGKLYNECAWEYFTYRSSPKDDCAECPPSMVEVLGLAETNNGDVHPSGDCQTTNPGYVRSVPVTLFGLQFLVTSDQSYPGVFAPVRFVWAECTDNTVTGFSGNELFMSSEVYDYGSDEPINETEGVDFPTYLGVQEECYLPYLDGSPEVYPRSVVFFNGGISIVDVDGWEVGDVNFNWVAPEMADVLVFARYFVEGLSVFEHHVDHSVMASDMDSDGIPLTIEDFVHLVRYVTGRVAPPISPTPASLYTAYFSQDPMTGAVSVDTPDSLGAVLLVFEGEIGDSCLSSQGMAMMQGFDGEKSYVFLYTLESGKFITSGEIFACGPAGELIEVHTATLDARPVTVALGPKPAAWYAVRIGTDFGWDGNGLPNHTFARVPVILERADLAWGLGGFDLLMAYDFNALRFMRADEGSMLLNCGWEYFTYRYELPDTNSTVPHLAQCQVVAIAETNNGADNHPNPDCQVDTPGWFAGLPDTLCYLYFSTVFDSTTACLFHPVRFYWTECKDNLLSTALMSHAGPLLLGSAMVYDYGSDEPINQTDGIEYPTFLGAQEECIDLPTLPDAIAPIRNVDFHNGGVAFACVDIIDEIGDINNNGIAFEIADGVMFARYFTQDTLAFGNHVDVSTRVSDVNGDHIPLTVEDFVLLERVIFGQANPTDPPPPPSPHLAEFQHDPVTGVVTLQTPDTLGAVYLLFRGEADGDCEAAAGYKHSCGFDGEYTRVFVHRFMDTLHITSGEILTLPGDLELVAGKTATYVGAKVVSQIALPTDGEIVVRIEKRQGAIRGRMVTLDIDLEESAMELGGFQILLSYDPSALGVRSVEAGSFLAECGWEYFTYRPCPYETSDDGCTDGYLRIFALAEFIDSVSAHPTCFLPSHYPATLASVNFIVYDYVPATRTFLPVRFFWWNDCSDNTFTDPSGAYNMLARNVHDYNGRLFRATDTFPTFAPDCVDPIVDFHLLNIDFYNGGIQLDSVETPGCEPGDINGNETAYEIRDLILYFEYYLHGWSVFGDRDSTCVAKALDVNEDGRSPSIADLICLFRIVIDNIITYPTKDAEAGTVTLYHDEVSNEVRATTGDSLGIVWMMFEGNIAPQAGDGFEVQHHFDGNYTRMLVTAVDPLDLPAGGQLITYTGEATLLQADAGSYDGSVINVIYGSPTDVGEDGATGLPNEFALDVNYPNPFNPATNIQYHVPRSSHVEIEIFNITGQRVRTLVNASKAAGTYTVVWNGTNQSGERVSSGMYFYRMTAGDYVKTRKMILLK